MENSKAPVVYSYEGNKITFFNGEGVMVNANQMAKPFPRKRPVDWLKTKSAQEFIETFSEVKKITSADLMRVIKGGDPKMQGTWMYQDVALEFARWLSPAFAIWCNDRIKELLTKGTTSIVAPSDKPWVRAVKYIKAAQGELQWMYEQIDQAHCSIEEHRKLLADSDDAKYTQVVLKSKTTWNTNVIAKEFGLSARTLNKKLEALGIQYKQHGVWLLSADYQNKGYAKTQTYNYLNREQEACTRLQTEWTEKGRKWLHELHNKGKF